MNTTIKVGLIIENKSNGGILLIKEKIKKKDRPLWNIVKGSYGDNGDETVFEAAVRECREEASVNVELTNILGIQVSKEGDQARIQFNFLAKIISGEPKIALEEEQVSRDEFIQEVKWFSRQELLELKKEEFIAEKIYEAVQDWLSGKKYPIEIIK
jgi:ADP-ribose pyrophosphatase YjhB (NUDIX family)